MILHFIFFASTALANPEINSVIPEFHTVVEKQIYRGGRPENDGLNELSHLGVKTILDLENDADVIGEEQSASQSLGLKFISKPMSGFMEPDAEEVNEIEKIMQDSANYPIFVHCQHGQDRTGLVFGLYRVFHDNWDAHEAYNEMLKYNFHPFLFLLDGFFKEKTKYQ